MCFADFLQWAPILILKYVTQLKYRKTLTKGQLCCRHITSISSILFPLIMPAKLWWISALVHRFHLIRCRPSDSGHCHTSELPAPAGPFMLAHTSYCVSVLESSSSLLVKPYSGQFQSHISTETRMGQGSASSLPNYNPSHALCCADHTLLFHQNGSEGTTSSIKHGTFIPFDFSVLGMILSPMSAWARDSYSNTLTPCSHLWSSLSFTNAIYFHLLAVLQGGPSVCDLPHYHFFPRW